MRAEYEFLATAVENVNSAFWYVLGAVTLAGSAIYGILWNYELRTRRRQKRLGYYRSATFGLLILGVADVVRVIAYK
jgi:hypothetical protein